MHFLNKIYEKSKFFSFICLLLYGAAVRISKEESLTYLRSGPDRIFSYIYNQYLFLYC